MHTKHTIAILAVLLLAAACGGEVEPTPDSEPAPLASEEPDDAGCRSISVMCAGPLTPACLSALRDLACDAPLPAECPPCVRASR